MARADALDAWGKVNVRHSNHNCSILAAKRGAMIPESQRNGGRPSIYDDPDAERVFDPSIGCWVLPHALLSGEPGSGQ